MSEMWAVATLDDVCTRITDGAHASPKSVDDGMPMASVKDMTPLGLNLGTARQIALDDYQKLVRQGCKPEVGDVLVAKDGATALDTVCRVREPTEVVLLSSVAILRPDQSKVTPEYLHYFMDCASTREYMKNAFTTGAAIPRVVLKDFKRAKIRFPNLPTQRRIASILSAYDGLVENNTRRIAILEEMARRIFDEWFVRFRFPGHENVRMAESELGLMPEGWMVSALGDVVDEIIDYRGKTPAKLGGEWVDDGIPTLSALNIKSGRLVNLNKSKFVDESLYLRWMKTPLRRGDILMTSEAPLGELFLLCDERRYCLSQRLFGIRANSHILLSPLLYLALESPQVQSELSSRATGATVSGIRQSELRKVPLVVPPARLQEQGDAVLSPLLNLRATLESANSNLRTTRDILLPKLISGELDVSAMPEPEAAAA